MNDIEKQQEEMFFIATDWCRQNTAYSNSFKQITGDVSVQSVAEEYNTLFGKYPEYVYVVSKQLTIKTPEYI